MSAVAEQSRWGTPVECWYRDGMIEYRVIAVSEVDVAAGTLSLPAWIYDGTPRRGPVFLRIHRDDGKSLPVYQEAGAPPGTAERSQVGKLV